MTPPSGISDSRTQLFARLDQARRDLHVRRLALKRFGTTNTSRGSFQDNRKRGKRGLVCNSSRFSEAAMFCVELNQPVEAAPVTTRTPLDEWRSIF